MKAAITVIAAFSALCAWHAHIEPSPGTWSESICEPCGGLREEILSDDGEITAVCKDGDRHGLVPSHNEMMGFNKGE